MDFPVCAFGANLARLLRLQRYGHRLCADNGHSSSRKLQLALPRPIPDRILAALAHVAEFMDPRLHLHPAGWESSRYFASDRQRACCDGHLWPVARCRLEFCRLGPLSRHRIGLDCGCATNAAECRAQRSGRYRPRLDDNKCFRRRWLATFLLSAR